MDKIKIKSIEIERCEGKTFYCVKKTFSTFKEVRTWLWGQAHSYPKDGGYDKHQFKITWEDGQTFSGRLDCKHWECPGNELDLQSHVENYLLVYSGKYRPSWFDDKRWEAFTKDNQESGNAAFFTEMLDKYEVKAT